MKKNVIGIDISKDKLDFCVLNSETMQVVTRGMHENNERSILKWIGQSEPGSSVFALEHTGHYGAMLIRCLSEKNCTFYVINPLELKKSLGIQRGKSDVKEAHRIAEYTISNRHNNLPTENLCKLKALIAARERYVKMSVQIQNSLKANKILNQSVDIEMLIREEEKQNESIRESIKAIEKEMKSILDSDLSLKNSFKQITSVIGVGPIIAIKCIAVTDNFTKFRDPRKFSCFCGLAPFPYQSGSSINGKTKTHFLRDRSLKALLVKGALTAIQHDPQIKTYYNRKVNEGKHHMCVINAVANKLVLRIFAVAKRETPFVKLVA